MSAGKGSSPRPYSVPPDEFAAKHEAIFGTRKKTPYIPPPLPGEQESVKDCAQSIDS